MEFNNYILFLPIKTSSSIALQNQQASRVLDTWTEILYLSCLYLIKTFETRHSNIVFLDASYFVT